MMGWRRHGYAIPAVEEDALTCKDGRDYIEGDDDDFDARTSLANLIKVCGLSTEETRTALDVLRVVAEREMQQMVATGTGSLPLSPER